MLTNTKFLWLIKKLDLQKKLMIFLLVGKSQKRVYQIAF